jgi:subtilisin family serine protease
MKLKRYILFILTLLVYYSNAQEKSCRVGGKNIKFKLATDKIIIKYDGKEPLDKTKLGRAAMVLSKYETLISADRFVYGLKADNKPEEIRSIISDLNEIPGVAFAAPFFETDYGNVALSNQFIVRLKDKNGLEEFEQLCIAHNFKICQVNKTTHVRSNEENKDKFLIEIPKNKILSTFELLAELQKNQLFKYIEPNFIRELDMYSMPNDAYTSSQWALNKINLPNAWNITTGSNTIKIAILDCGIDLSHADLLPNLDLGYDATYGTVSSYQQNTYNSFGGLENNDTHGTSCAGIAGAKGNNTIGITGASQNCRIVPIRCARSYTYYDGAGTVHDPFYADDYIYADAIDWARTNADILSLSWGGGTPSSVIMDAIDDAYNNGRTGKGCLIFAASGNDNIGVSFPASYEKVIAVGATNETDVRCSPTDWVHTPKTDQYGNPLHDAFGNPIYQEHGSNYGVNLDVAAPGNNIMSTDLHGTPGESTTDYINSFSGTSAACPYAAGVAGLILSINPGLTQTQARYTLESTCDKVGGYFYFSASYSQPNGTWSSELGYGRINAQAAVTYAQSLIPAPPGGAGTPVVANMAANSTVCWKPGLSTPLTINVSGGNPVVGSGGVLYYNCVLYTDAAHTTTAASDITYAAAFSAQPGVPRILAFDFPGGAPSLPLSRTYYLDVVGADLLHHYNVATISVNFYSTPSITVSDQNVCKGVDVYLGYPSPVPTGGTPPYTYQWGPPSPNLFLITSATGGYVTSIQATADYTLTIIDNNGCSSNDIAHIDVNQLTANAGPDKNICISTTTETIGLPVTPGVSPYTYSWSPSTGLSSSTIASPTIVPSVVGSTNYTLTITDAQGCSSQDNVTVAIGNIYPTAGAGADLMVCAGADLNLTGSFTSQPGATLTWSTGTTNFPGVVVGSQYISTINPMTTATYNFTVTNSNGCSATDALVVNINLVLGPSVNLGSDINGICSETPINLTAVASGGVIPYTYSWQSGSATSTNTYSYTPTHPHGYPTPPPYTITVTVYDHNGCVSSDNIVVSNVNELPSLSGAGAYFQKCLSDSPVYMAGPAAYAGYGTPPYTYQWTPSYGLDNPTLLHPMASPGVSTDYQLEITDANGCKYKGFYGYVNVYNAPPIVDFLIGGNCQPELSLINNTKNVSARPTPGIFYVADINEYYDWNYGSGITPGTSSSVASYAYWGGLGATYDYVFSGANRSLTGVPAGLRSISLTVTTKNSANNVCYSATKTKDVYVVPSVSVSSTIAVPCGAYTGTAITNDKVANTITTGACSTTISSGAQAIYIGGSGAVTLSPGFNAVTGSKFWAFIETDCLLRSPETENTDPEQSKTFLLYPNPNNGSFKIDFNFGESTEKIQLEVCNLQGQIVKRIENIDPQTKTIDVSLPGQDNGMYLVKITNGSATRFFRFNLMK